MARLIDVDELKEAVDAWDKFGYTAQGELIRLTEENKDLYVPYVKYQDIVNCIDNAPTMTPVLARQVNGSILLIPTRTFEDIRKGTISSIEIRGVKND